MMIRGYIILASLFLQGFMSYPFNSGMFIYLRSRLSMSVMPAKLVYHLHLTVCYSTMAAMPSILWKIRRVYLVNFIVSVGIVLFVLLLAVIAILDEVLAHGLEIFNESQAEHRFGDSHKHEGHDHHHDVHGLIKHKDNHGSHWSWYCSFPTMLTISALWGAVRVTTRHVLAHQLDLPDPSVTSNQRAITRIVVSSLGELLGLSACLIFGKQGVHVSHLKSFVLVWSASILNCVLLAVGFKFVKADEDMPTGIYTLAINRWGILWANYWGKERQETDLTVERSEKWKALVRVIPLFVPVGCIIAYRDQRFGQFQNQNELLDPDYNGFIFPSLSLNLIYPFTRLVGAFVVDGAIFPSLKRFGWPVSMPVRAVMGFVFVTASLALAMILHCHVENTKIPTQPDHVAALIFYNSLNCRTVARIESLTNTIEWSPLSMTEVTVPWPKKIEHRTIVVKAFCPLTVYRLKTTIAISKDEIREYFYFLGENSTKPMLEQMAVRGLATDFYVHTKLKVIVSSTKPIDVVVAGFSSLDGEERFHFEGVVGTQEFPPTNIPPHRYLFSVNGITLLDTEIGYGSSLTFMVVQLDERRIPDTKLFTLVAANVIPMCLQIPQGFIMGLSDVMLESPAFLYASTTLPQHWRYALIELWDLSGGIGHLVCVVFSSQLTSRIPVLLLAGFGCCWLSVALTAQLYASVYVTNYDKKELDHKSTTTDLEESDDLDARNP